MDSPIFLIHVLLFLIGSIYPLLLPNIAFNKPTYMSSTYDSLTASDNAVDGDKTDLSHTGGQCAISAVGHKTAWWWVDLGDLSSITNITIHYLTGNAPWGESNGYTTRFVGFSVFVSNTTNKEDGSLCFHDNEIFNRSTIPAVLTLNCEIQGRYVIYFNQRSGMQPSFYSLDAYVELCELEVYGCVRGNYGENCMRKCPVNCLYDTCIMFSGTCYLCDDGYKGPICDNECDGGKYGPGCSLTCGACINNTPCHHTNGSCLQGCNIGFQGQKCDEECPFGKYGNNCQYNCSAACKSPYNCSRTTGECVGGCQPGWKEAHCNHKCDNGTFGRGCGHKCGECFNSTQCNNIDGVCEFGCAPGFLGVTCKDECPFGKFGLRCAYNCSMTCIEQYTCEGTTGKCVGGCQPGWKGVQCDQECDGRTYGLHCIQTCGACINNSYCHHVSGMCPWGCDNGFQGMNCNEESQKMGSPCAESNTIQNLAISIAISIFIVLLGTILNIAIWKRNQFKSRSKHSQHITGKDDAAKPNLDTESTYTELGTVNKQNVYDDIRHYS